MERSLRSIPRALQDGSRHLQQNFRGVRPPIQNALPCQNRFMYTDQHSQTQLKRRRLEHNRFEQSRKTTRVPSKIEKTVRIVAAEHNEVESVRVELQLSQRVDDGHQLSLNSRIIFGKPALPSSRNSYSYCTTNIQGQSIQKAVDRSNRTDSTVARNSHIKGFAQKRNWLKSTEDISHLARSLTQRSLHQLGINEHDPREYCQLQAVPTEERVWANEPSHTWNTAISLAQNYLSAARDVVQPESYNRKADHSNLAAHNSNLHILMTSDSPKTVSETSANTSPARHRPLVVGLTKPSSQTNTMAASEAAAALNKEIEKNVAANTKSAAPGEEGTSESSTQPKQKKEKAPKQAKPPKAAPAAAPTSPALIDLRVGHILRAIAHPNADSLYVSTIAMGDPEGTEHTQVDEETGKVVRTVCSGLNGLVPLAEMQNRKIIVVANLKPVNMRSIKSAAMVLAASPKQEEGADPHAPDRVVELVMPPAGSEAGDKVYFEGWPYGEGLGPEKQLNPKKKQWEAIQPGFYTSDDLVVGFDASNCDEVSGSDKGNLVVEGKGVCTVKTLKGAVVR